MNTIQKLGVMMIAGAMLYTAVAPQSQTPKLVDSFSNLWNTGLKTITGQR